MQKRVCICQDMIQYILGFYLIDSLLILLLLQWASAAKCLTTSASEARILNPTHDIMQYELRACSMLFNRI